MKPKILIQLLMIFMIVSCRNADLGLFEYLRGQQEKSLSKSVDGAASEKIINQNIITLKKITYALQKQLKVKSFTSSSNAYKLNMNDGSQILLHKVSDDSKGEDNRSSLWNKGDQFLPQLAVEQDSTGQYFWTIANDFIIQGGQKIPVFEQDQAGIPSQKRINPVLKYISTTNQWFINLTEGNNWQIVEGGKIHALQENMENEVMQSLFNPISFELNQGFSVEANDQHLTITYQLNDHKQRFELPIVDWQISLGDNHACYLNPKGILYGVGYNLQGQLGIGNKSNRTKPIIMMTDVKQVSVGTNYTLALKNDGTVWASGENNDGQLGTGDQQRHYAFVKVADNVKYIAATYLSSFIIKNDGSLWATGFNEFGQLGIGHNNFTSNFTPVKIPKNRVKTVVGTYAHTLILNNDGSLFGVGSNEFHQLGLDQSLTKDTIRSGAHCTFRPVQISLNVKAAACSYQLFSVLLKNDGTAWVTGQNDKGQLGTGDYSSRSQFTKVADNIKSIQAGFTNTILLNKNGNLLVAGKGQYDDLGTRSESGISQFKKIASQVEKIVGFSGSSYIIKKNDGSYWGAGYNQDGNLLIGNNDNASTFTKTTLPKYYDDEPESKSFDKLTAFAAEMYFKPVGYLLGMNLTSW